MIEMQQNIGFAFLKLILSFLTAVPMWPLIASVGPSLNNKKLFLQLPHEIMNYY